MFQKLFKIIFLISQMKDNKKLYYKSATINGEKGCVQSYISDKTAKRLDASPGKCNDINCNTYKGEHVIPLLCTLQCFVCEGFI